MWLVIMFFIVWFALIILLVLYNYKNLLHIIILLEFVSISTMLVVSFIFFNSQFLLVMIFSIFVVESVLALSGMILIVSSTGTDYVSSSSLLKS